MCLPLLLSRQTMVVTTEYCEVLYVEADHMRRIYEVTLRYTLVLPKMSTYTVIVYTVCYTMCMVYM